MGFSAIDYVVLAVYLVAVAAGSRIAAGRADRSARPIARAALLLCASGASTFALVVLLPRFHRLVSLPLDPSLLRAPPFQESLQALWIAAFLETVAVYQEQAVVQHLWDYGAKLITGLEALAREAGVAQCFQLQGNAVSMNYLTFDRQGQPSLPLRTLFSQEMIRHAVLMPWIAQSFSHGETELQRTLEAARQALAVYAQALEGGVERFLQGPVIKPVFRQFN